MVIQNEPVLWFVSGTLGEGVDVGRNFTNRTYLYSFFELK